MQLIGNEREIDEAGQLFMRRLKNGCRVVTCHAGGPDAGGHDGAGTVHLHPRGFWFTLRQEQGGGLVAAMGMGRPLLGEEPFPACLMPLGLVPGRPGHERPTQGRLLFARFGGDVLALHDGGTDIAPGREFIAFLEARGYGPTVHSLAGPDGWERQVAIVASLSSPDPGPDLLRFLSAVNDFRQWRAQGLEPACGSGCTGHGPDAEAAAGLSGRVSGTARAMAVAGSGTNGTGEELAASRGGADTHGAAGAGEDGSRIRAAIPGDAALSALVLEGLRASLERHAQARGLGCTVADSPSGGLTLCSREGVVLAAFQVRPDLSAEGLFDAVGRLLLSRGNVRAAKFLVLPGGLGPFFSQALFRHDIQAVRYQLRGSAVVLDAGEIFATIDA